MQAIQPRGESASLTGHTKLILSERHCREFALGTHNNNYRQGQFSTRELVQFLIGSALEET